MSSEDSRDWDVREAFPRSSLSGRSLAAREATGEDDRGWHIFLGPDESEIRLPMSQATWGFQPSVPLRQ